MKRISILGAGWLGSPLALQLRQKGHTVKVSTTTPAKVDFFAAQGIDCYLVDLGASGNQQEALQALLSNTDQLIITVPPGRQQQDLSGSYADRISAVLPLVVQQGIPELIFTSSTTVYLSQRGEVDEDTVIQPVSDMDRQIYDIEQRLLAHPAFNATILRLGALIGEDRHPVRYIVQRPEVTEANNPVNMIHRHDILRFMDRVIAEALPNEIFNLVAPIHRSRRDFYTAEAHALGLAPLPLFTDNPDADMRRVLGHKIAQRYGLDYEWLGHAE
jgi:nucleoside-diphosphate-sugar epimerase